MTTERFSFTGEAGTNHYLAIFNAAGQIFDWNDSTFKALSAPPTTKAVIATEQADLGGTGKSAFIKDVNLALLNNTTTPAKFRADWYTDNAATVLVSNTIEFTVTSGDLGEGADAGGWGEAVGDPAATITPTSTRAQVLAWLLAKECNQQTQSKTLQTVASSDGTVISQAAVNSDGTTVTRAQFGDPP